MSKMVAELSPEGRIGQMEKGGDQEGSSQWKVRLEKSKPPDLSGMQ